MPGSWRPADDVARPLLEAAIDCAAAESLTAWSVSLSEAGATALANAGFNHFDDSGGAEGYEPSFAVLGLGEEAAGNDLVVADRSLLNANNWNIRPAFTDIA